MSELQGFVDARRELFLEELRELLVIPSVSTDPERQGDVGKSAGRPSHRDA